MPKPKIISMPKADELIPLVNKADRAARLLFRFYSKHPGIKSSRYEQYLLTPNLSLYAKLLHS